MTADGQPERALEREVLREAAYVDWVLSRPFPRDDPHHQHHGEGAAFVAGWDAALRSLADQPAAPTPRTGGG